MGEIRKSVFAHVRAAFLRGVAVIIPLALTIWFFRALLNAVDGIFSPLLEEWLGRHIPGLGFLSMLVIILLVGLFTRNLVGRLLFGWFESLLRTIPFVRSVYSAVKDLVNAFALDGKGKTFRQVVMIEYPRKGLYTIGFVTNEMPYLGPDLEKATFLNVYIPNPPNPTSGMLVLVPPGEAVPLALTVEQGLKLVLSGGIVIPEILTGKRSTKPGADS
jgi:uncharacterized membrane protein